MFDCIAARYDLLNHLLSLGIDRHWRTRAIRLLDRERAGEVLDVACGTGDFSFAAARHGAYRVTGIDIAPRMLDIARQKARMRGLHKRVTFREGEAENLDFPPGSFDAVIIAFGARNFENIKQATREVYRVLRPGGKFIVLEFSTPGYFPVKQLYHFYFTRFLPCIGGMISGHRQAYDYLPASVRDFPAGERFLEIPRAVGFTRLIARPLTSGIVTLYSAEKPGN